jgi:cytochrome c556
MRFGSTCVLILAAFGCAPPAQVRYEERVETAQPGSEHAVHADRLLEVMRGLDRLTGERLPRSMDVEWERERRVAELVEVANSIADSAARISGATEGGIQSAQERGEFRAHARVLEQRATTLAETAPQLSQSEIDAQIDGIRQACAACHARFRGSDPQGDSGW